MFLSSYAGNLTSWSLEKYAKFVSTTQESCTNPNQSQQGQWKQFSSQDGSLQVSLLENHLLVSNGGMIHHDSRRFRIKFNKNGTLSALENCRQFVSRMSHLVPVKEISSSSEADSQIRTGDSQQPTGLTDSRHETITSAAAHEPTEAARTEERSTFRGLRLPQLAQKMTSEPCGLSGRAYGHMTNLPTDRLNLMIRLCLTDANFPSFVEAVQKELLEITSENVQTQ